MSLCGYTKDKLLGKGSYASVWSTKEGFAVKKLTIDQIGSNDDLLSEINITRKISHPNVISFKNVSYGKNKICLAMDIADLSLPAYITNNSLTPDMKDNLSWALVRGLDYLHQNNILHIDLHLNNILIFFENDIPVPKICDFGQSKIILDKEILIEFALNNKWSPPDILIKEYENAPILLDTSYDNWRLGYIISYIWNGILPFGDLIVANLLPAIRQSIGLTPDQEIAYRKHVIPVLPKELLDNPPKYMELTIGLPYDSPFWILLNPDPNVRKDLKILTHENASKINYLPFERNKNYDKMGDKFLLSWLWDVVKTENISYLTYLEAIEIYNKILNKIPIHDLPSLSLVALLSLKMALAITTHNTLSYESIMDLTNLPEGTIIRNEWTIAKKLGFDFYNPPLPFFYPEKSKLEILNMYFDNDIPYNIDTN